MRVLLGLAALAAAVNGQVTVTLTGASTASLSAAVPVGATALSQISVFTAVSSVTPNVAITGAASTGSSNSISPALGSGWVNSGNYAITIDHQYTQVQWIFLTNIYTAQIQHRWSPNYANPAIAYPNNNLNPTSYTCDTCSGGTPISCNTAVGPGATPSPALGYACANLLRTYTMTNIISSIAGSATPFVNSFSVQLLDRNTNPGPNTSSYSFTIVRIAPPVIGDPQIYGLQGQDFQVHGIPDEIFNMITYPNLQVNARFAYLSSGECIDNYTACFAHPGTYISEEGIRLGSDKIHVRAGSAKKGLSVSVNGQKLSAGKQSVKLGSVEIVNHRRVVITTPIMALSITNSDKFLNQETQLFDSKLLALGSERRTLADNEQFHPEVPLHGLQGQTWRNVEYPSGLEYEGSISDYHVTDGNLFGSSFVFNQFAQ